MGLVGQLNSEHRESFEPLTVVYCSLLSPSGLGAAVMENIRWAPDKHS